MIRIRYFGGGLGRMPSSRRTYRLTKPRGFLRPDISVSRACSVPMPPPPPMFMPPMTNRLRRPVSGAGSACAVIAERVSRVCASEERYENPWHPFPAANGAGVAPRGKPGPCEIAPRLPSESASSRKTITPP